MAALPFPLCSFLALAPLHTTLNESQSDFFITDWTQEETEVPGDNTHLWEESWDDDDTSEDFSAQLKYVSMPGSALFTPSSNKAPFSN